MKAQTYLLALSALCLLLLDGCSESNRKKTASPILQTTSWNVKDSILVRKGDQGRFTVADIQAILLVDSTQSPVSEKIREAIRANYRLAVNDTCPIKEIPQTFFSEYRTLQKELGDYGIPWTYKAKAKQLQNNDSLFSIQNEEWSYTGGAHGSHIISYLNLDPQTGNKLTLKNLFKNEKIKRVNKSAELAFREKFQIPAKSDINMEGRFSFPNNRFSLPKNFTLSDSGLVFTYNPYEVAPYSEGIITIFVSKDKYENP